MFNLFKRNKKENKLYKVVAVFNIERKEVEEINEIMDSAAVRNLGMNGFDIIEIEEI
jgi:hypothetical protein